MIDKMIGYISKKAAINAVNSALLGYQDNEAVLDALDYANQEIRDIPAADVVPKKE